VSSLSYRYLSQASRYLVSQSSATTAPRSSFRSGFLKYVSPAPVKPLRSNSPIKVLDVVIGFFAVAKILEVFRGISSYSPGVLS